MADKHANYSRQSVQIYSANKDISIAENCSELITIYFISISLKITHINMMKIHNIDLSVLK